MSSWRFPGARWWKFDFHTHTPASSDFSDRQMSQNSWLREFMSNEIDCVAVTDHNSGDWIDSLKQALCALETTRPDWYRPLHLFPGVEISADGGVHILAIFDPSKASADINRLLGSVGYKGKPGLSEREAEESLAKIIPMIADFGGVAVPAHVDKNKGLFRHRQGIALKSVLHNQAIHAMELCDTNFSKPELYASEKIDWAEVCGSDYHGGEESGVGSYTWVKMETPSIEGLRLALIDGDASINRNTEADPNAHAECVIEKFTVANAKFVGRPDPVICEFSPFLNSIIGGRGSGKSTLLEFVRLALRQEQGLPSRLKEDYQDYFSTDQEGGLLTKDAELRLYYRKGGARYRLNWSEKTDVPSIEQEDAETKQWHPAEGEITSLFPASIYSQKQIFELAGKPQGLLGIIDRAPKIRIDECLAARRTCGSLCKQLRQQRVELVQKINEEKKLKGQLNDVDRQVNQINRQIAQKKQSGYDDKLRKYRSRQRQLREIDYVGQHWQDFLNALRESLDSHEAATIDERIFSEHPEILAELQNRQRQWQKRIDDIRRIADSVQNDLESWNTERGEQDWMKAINEDFQQYRQLQDLLDEMNIDPSKYPNLLQEHSRIEEELKQIQEYKQQSKILLKQFKDKVEEAERHRIELTDRRKRFIARVLSGNQNVKMTIDPFAEPWEEAEQNIRTMLQTKSHFQKDFEQLASIYEKHEGGWKEVKDRILKIRKSEASPADTRFRQHLLGLPDESITDLLLWFPEDALQITYGPGDRTMRRSSPGQKSAALLAFILSYGDKPLLLDQPEDDLDNDLIYSLIVQSIKDTKTKRQIIIVTHNPNIVVNGDSEMVHYLSVGNGQSRVSSGSIQSESVRERICDTMEGGSKAFQNRYKRINLQF